MKHLFFVLVFAALAFANNDGCTETSVAVDPHGSCNNITLTLINDWTLTNMALGLDVLEGSSRFYVLGTDYSNGWIQVYDAISGSPLNTLPLDAANTFCFGVAWNDDYTTDTYYTNDWVNDFLYYSEDSGLTWTTETNPSGHSGRGMDFDGTDYWTTISSGGLWRFQPGVSADSIDIPEFNSQPSGLTVFPYNSNLCVAITTYNPPFNIYFYEWDGTTMSSIGSAACPASPISLSYGLAYAETNGNIFWSYNSGGTCHLAEFSFSLTSLERSSWGSIKASF